MRQLDCDFCGATATGAYEVLPAELDPAPDEQVRVVLCGDCRETLDGVLAPLLDRLDAGDVDGDVGEPDGDAAVDAASDPATSDPATSDPAAATPEATSSVDDADGEPSATLSGTAVTAETAPDEAETVTESGAEDRTPSADADVDADAAGGETAGDETTGEETTDVAESPATGGEEPANFRQVMRLLNNREFPVDRAEVADLAAGAYDLGDREVAEIFDYAIERGVLAEENGRLVKG